MQSLAKRVAHRAMAWTWHVYWPMPPTWWKPKRRHVIGSYLKLVLKGAETCQVIFKVFQGSQEVFFFCAPGGNFSILDSGFKKKIGHCKLHCRTRIMRHHFILHRLSNPFVPCLKMAKRLGDTVHFVSECTQMLFVDGNRPLQVKDISQVPPNSGNPGNVSFCGFWLEHSHQHVH